MKANELRIGNIVNKKFADCDSYEWSFFRSAEFSELEKYPDIFKPIELTDEWLIKFGFEKKYSEYHRLNYWDRGDFKLLLRDQGNGEYTPCNNGLYLYSRGKRFKYVHQLQNLYYSLNLEELTIKE